MKIERKRSGVVGLVGVAIVVVALVWLLREQEAAPGAMLDSPLPTPTVVSPNTADAPPTLISVTECAVDKALPKEGTLSMLDEYTFSPPEVILTHDAVISIVDWLPDNQRLLIIRELTHTNVEVIETFDLRDNAITPYGQREGSPGRPIWIENTSAIVYPMFRGDSFDLMWSQNEKEPKRITSNVDPFSLAFVAGNNRILYVAEKDERQVFLTDTSGDRIETVFADQKIRGPQTQFAWRPNSSLLAAYTYPMLQLFNIDTSDLCEVQMGERIEVGPYWVWRANGVLTDDISH